MVLADYKDNEITDELDPIPSQVQMVLSAMEVGNTNQLERRLTGRASFRMTTQFRLFRDGTGAPARVLYTRDINRRGVGFITPHRLPLGYGGIMRLPADNGGTTEVHCTLLRCREAAPGWYEGSAYFNRDQPQFDR